MTPDVGQVPRPERPDEDERFVATARWDGERWAVSVPNYGGQGRANIFAETLAEAVPNAALVIGALICPRPADLESRIDVEPYLDPEVVERFKNAADPFDAATVLRGAGLCEEDIRDIVVARLYSVIAPTPRRGGPVDPWEGGR
jgi:hypothetical protein